MDDNKWSSDEPVNSLVNWAVREGAKINPAIYFARDAQRGIHVRIRDDAGNLAPAENIAEIPNTLSISYLNAANAGFPGSAFESHASPFPPRAIDEIEPNTIAALFLVQQYLLGSDSFWYPYLSTLPQPLCSEAPLPLSDIELKYLEGTSLEHDIKARLETWQSEWKQATALLAKLGWDTTKYSWDLTLWAFSILQTRGFYGHALYGSISDVQPTFRVFLDRSSTVDNVLLVLFPLLDLINHSNSCEPIFTESRTGFAMAIEVGVPAGAEVSHSYCPDPTEPQHMSNRLLLRDHGFCIAGNECIEVPLSLGADMGPFTHSQVYFGDSETSSKRQKELSTSFRLCSHSLGFDHALNPLQNFHKDLVARIAFAAATPRERAMLLVDSKQIPSASLLMKVVEKLLQIVQQSIERIQPQSPGELIFSNKALEIYKTEELKGLNTIATNLEKIRENLNS